MTTLNTYLKYLSASDDVDKYCAITGSEREEALTVPISEIEAKVTSFATGLNTMRNVLKQEVKINGIEFGFHNYLKDMSMAEYIDLVGHMKKYPQSLPSIMAILYRPIVSRFGTKYKIEDYDAGKHRENAELMRDLPIDYVNGVMVFFYLLRNNLLNSSLDSLQTELQEILTQTVTEIEEEVEALVQRVS
jgi:hypothetical protein